MGALSGSAAGQVTGNALTGGGKVKPYRSFNVGPPQANVSLSAILEEVNFEWVSERGVRLKSVNGVELLFNV